MEHSVENYQGGIGIFLKNKIKKAQRGLLSQCMALSTEAWLPSRCSSLGISGQCPGFSQSFDVGLFPSSPVHQVAQKRGDGLGAHGERTRRGEAAGGRSREGDTRAAVSTKK